MATGNVTIFSMSVEPLRGLSQLSLAAAAELQETIQLQIAASQPTGDGEVAR
jgi:hypothetical protein